MTKLKSNILYCSGIVIICCTFLFKPYSKEYFEEKQKSIDNEIAQEIIEFEPLRIKYTETIKHNTDIICGDSLNSNLDIDSLKYVNHFLEKKLYSKLNEIVTDEIELKIGLVDKSRTNKIYLFGLMTIGLFLIVGSKINKDE